MRRRGAIALRQPHAYALFILASTRWMPLPAQSPSMGMGDGFSWQLLGDRQAAVHPGWPAGP